MIILYTFVVYNKHNIRDKLISYFPPIKQDASDIMKDEENNTLKNISNNKLSINKSVAICD